jgi:ectoine hydroxylase-related dioxygenase (phytanoyl-CoA dioxygenase family)
MTNKTRHNTPFSSWKHNTPPAGWFSESSDPRIPDFYRENGFTILKDAVSAEDVERIKRDAVRICRGEAGEVDGIVPSTSADSDAEVLRNHLCIHNPHLISKEIGGFLNTVPIVDILTRVIGPNVKCCQSMLFIKSAGKPGQAWHQDEYFIPTRDRSLIGAWIALDDATVENGCLWVIPGSHRSGIIWPQEKHNDPEFDCTGEAVGFPYTQADEVPVEVTAGSIVFFNGYLLHRSRRNRAASGYRRVLVNHYLSAESLLPWFAPNNLPAPVGRADSRNIIMVAGVDPYAWKGTALSKKAHVRPSGEGGCPGSAKKMKTDETP